MHAKTVCHFSASLWADHPLGSDHYLLGTVCYLKASISPGLASRSSVHCPVGTEPSWQPFQDCEVMTQFP